MKIHFKICCPYLCCGCYNFALIIPTKSRESTKFLYNVELLFELGNNMSTCFNKQGSAHPLPSTFDCLNAFGNTTRNVLGTSQGHFTSCEGYGLRIIVAPVAQ